MFPTSAQALAGHILSRLPFTPFNMVCTNVPGPQQPLYLLGHKMLHRDPYVPIGGEMPLNCAILTYNGTAYFGFSGCAHAAPDLRRLEDLLQLSFTELRKPPESGPHAGRKRSQRRECARKRKLHRLRHRPRRRRFVQPFLSLLLASVVSVMAAEPPVKEQGSARLTA